MSARPGEAQVSTLLFVWAVIWILLFPAMAISDADNGRFNHDLHVIWLPEFGLSVLGAIACLVALSFESKRPRLWAILAAPVVSIVAIATLSLFVLPAGR